LRRVPSLEEEYARANPARVDVLAWDDADGPWAVLECVLAMSHARTVAVEKDTLTVRVFDAIRHLLDASLFQDASPMITELRMRKSPAELDALRAAAAVVDGCLREVPPLLRAGRARLTSRRVAELDRPASSCSSSANEGR
jgi:Xaa-Pro dipeptidase